jgi:hypothetical protein
LMTRTPVQSAVSWSECGDRKIPNPVSNCVSLCIPVLVVE